MVSEKNGPNSGSCIHNTPHTNHNFVYGSWWINVGFSEYCWLLFQELATEIKLSLINKQNECGGYFSSLHPMKVPVHKIHSMYLAYVSYRNTQWSSGIPIVTDD